MRNKKSIIIKDYKNLSLDLEKSVSNLKAKDKSSKERKSLEQRASHNDRYHSEKDRIRYVFAFSDNEIVGRVIVLKRNIKFHGRKIILGGIGGVRTHISWRRKGIATLLLEKAISILKEEQCDIAFLYTRKELFPLYEKVGFIPLNRQFTYIGRSGKRYLDWDGMIAQINSPYIFEEVLHDDQPFDIGGGNW